MIEHEQYYRKGGTYELPIEIYNDLIEQIKEAQKERNEYKQLYKNALKINQNTEKYRTELETKYVVLQQENERLNNKIKEQNLLLIEFQDMEQKVNIYKSRCEKANEYVNKMWLAKLTPDIVSKTKGDLQNILNGSDEK